MQKHTRQTSTRILLKCTFDDNTSSYYRLREKERKREREGCTVHNTVSDHLANGDEEGCKLHEEVTHGTSFAYQAFKVFFMLGIQ